jgi:uncharacterized protein (TIGR00255 family)
VSAADAATASMTGSGVAAGPTELGELCIELRSVNGRGLSIKHRLCADVAGLESRFESVIRQRLQRGSVSLFVERRGLGGSMPDREDLRSFVAELRALSSDLGLPDDLSLRDVLALVQGGKARPASLTDLPPQLSALLDRAIDQLVSSRKSEGAVTVGAMRASLTELDRLRQEAVARAPQIVIAYRDRLEKRLADFLQEKGMALEAYDIVREVGIFAERSDVSEELQRLDSHLREVEATLDQHVAVGRRLEFLLQEVLRETNTLGSKSPDVEMAHIVVAMKSNIDKLKEQAANLE